MTELRNSECSGKFLAQHLQQQAMPQCGVYFPQLCRQPGFVHAAQLIQQHPPRLAAHEHFGPTAGRRPSTGNWRNDHPRQHRVHIVGRHHQAGAFFLDFCADGEVKIHPIHRAAPCLQLSPDPLRTTFIHQPVAPHILVSRCVVTREPCRAGIDSASFGCSRYHGNTLRFRRHRRLLRTGGLAHIPCCPPAHANWRQ